MPLVCGDTCVTFICSLDISMARDSVLFPQREQPFLFMGLFGMSFSSLTLVVSVFLRICPYLLLPNLLPSQVHRILL